MNDGSWRWSKERVELLKKLNEEGHPYAVIASRLGAGITKNAVSGKIDRLGLASRGSNKVSVKSRKAKSKVKPWRHLQVFGMVDKNSPKAVQVDGYVPPADTPAPLHQRKTIQTLEKEDCRWPIGDPQLEDFHFCGAERIPGLPYCELHHRRAFQPPKSRVVREITHMPIRETENA